MKTLHEQPLMPRGWLLRRMTRLVRKGQKGGALRFTVTLVDISKWFGVHYDLIRHMEDGRIAITDEWQVKLSQFFYLFDMGLIVLKVKGRSKTWERATPVEPPCKPPMPRVDFLTTSLTFD